jgi:glycoside/pentoside/hexuronide:cation symporter, GPH family
MQSDSQKIPMREKVGYSLGDASTNFVFQLMLMFQLGFYTDVFGITAAAAGTLLLVGRFWDAFFDPMMGIIADRTNTRWGKFRPWILWSAVPFAILFILVFRTPDYSQAGKMVYAYVTYILLMTLYSVNNTPYSALHGVMTSSIKERTSIASIRFICSMGAAFLVQGLTLPMVAMFGKGDAQKGWTMSISVFAIIMVVFYVITFFSTHERIKPAPDQKSDVKQDIKDLAKNKPWMSMFILTLFIFITLAIWGSGMYYFFNYYIDQNSLFDFLKSFGLVNVTGEINGWWHKLLDTFGLIAKADHSNVFGVGFSFFNMSGQLVTIIGVLFSKMLAMRFGKKNVFIVGLSLTTLFTGLFIIVPAENVSLAFTLNILKSLAYGPTIPLLWAMMGDVADYSEWKTQRRATGFIFAGIVFALKAGLGFGGAICGWILGAFGYARNVVPDHSVLLGIRLSSSIFPAITFSIGVIALLYYGITKKLNEQIQLELTERRKAFNQE